VSLEKRGLSIETIGQGDQIGRIFAHWALWAVFLKLSEVAHIFVLLSSTVKDFLFILAKMGLATFWVIFFLKLIWSHCGSGANLQISVSQQTEAI
jgi:hypothetical protein